jgi:SAM-dependent methyltransferase
MKVKLIARRVLLASAVAVALLAAAHFPYDVDAPEASQIGPESRQYYEQAYTAGDTTIQYGSAIKAKAADSPFIELVTEFVRTYGLQDKRVLEVGAGLGTLQDVVADYVGLDIAESARVNFHKPFVQGSATDLPFRDSQFDAILTCWTLEHVPNPEQALAEMRRVVRDGGYLYIAPAFDVPWWRSAGVDVLPTAELGAKEKILRATILPIQSSLPYIAAHRVPAHAMRYAGWRLSGTPTRLHYKRLVPNYERFLGSDSDAVNALDAFEIALWYESRGDQCLNCVSGLHQIVRVWGHPLVIRVRKSPTAAPE